MEPFMRRNFTDPMKSLETTEMKQKLTPSLLRFMSICGISYCFLVTSLIFLTSLTMTLPVVCPESSDYRPRAVLLVFMLFGIGINFFFVSRRRSFFRVGVLTGLPDPSWRKCVDCDHNVPPRAHHCPLCRRCVMRRDHHCFFTGSCVGFENQRYFIIFCFYCGVGSIYCFYLMQQYIILEFLQHESMSFIHYILPIAVTECILLYMSVHLLYCIFICYLCFISATGSLGIFVWQLFLAVFDTTTFEFTNGNWSLKTSIGRNIRSVFGPWWLLNFIMPMPWFRTPGNGVDWNVSKYV